MGFVVVNISGLSSMTDGVGMFPPWGMRFLGVLKG